MTKLNVFNQVVTDRNATHATHFAHLLFDNGMVWRSHTIAGVARELAEPFGDTTPFAFELVAHDGSERVFVLLPFEGEQCEPCHSNGQQRPAAGFVTSRRGDLFIDQHLCASCLDDRNRQEHEDAVWLAYNDYQDTLHGFEAGTGRI